MLRDDFSIRFYRWSERDLAREINGGFPLLRQVQDLKVNRFIEHVSSLSEESRRVLIGGLVKRFHTHAVQLVDTPTSAAELLAVQEYLNTGIRIDKLHKHLRRSLIRAAINEHFICKFPFDRVEWDGALLKTECRMPDCTFITVVDLESAADQLSYHHRLEGGAWFYDRISILSWMGIAFATTWSEESDPTVLAKSLASVYEHFANALPKLLASTT